MDTKQEQTDEAQRAVNPEALLTSLHGDPSKEANKNVILLVEPDPSVREVCVRLLHKIFPSYQIEYANSDNEAVSKIREELAQKVAMIIDLDDNGESTLSFVRADTEGHLLGISDDATGEGFKKIPVIMSPKNSQDDDSLFQKLLEEGEIDGVLEKPFGREDLEANLSASIQRRLGIFKEIETSARKAVLSNFVQRAEDLIPFCKKAILGLSCYPKEGEEMETNSSDDELITVVESLIQLEKEIANLKELGPDVDNDHLRKSAHDLNNKLTPSVSYLELFLIDDTYKFNPKDLAILQQIHPQLMALVMHLQAIMAAYKGQSSTWASIKAGKVSVAPKGSELILPKGCEICVVDDDETVQKVCSSLIRSAGGIVQTPSCDDFMIQICSEEDHSNADVVLLDNDLGRYGKGHSLIPLIRFKWPDALIIAHTSDAIEINGNHSNPYKSNGVEVVGKLDTKAISGIVRRKLGPSKTPVTK